MLLRKSVLSIWLIIAIMAFLSGCDDDLNNKPIINRITSTHECGTAPLDVQFVVLASGGDPLDDSTGGNSWLETKWDFGDGHTANNSITVHRFEHPGRYVVVATVTDKDGDSDNKTLEIIIREEEMTVSTNPDTTVVASWHRFDEPTIGGPNPGSSDVTRPGIVFNELLIFNDSIIENSNDTPDGPYSPCLELYNNSPDRVEMEGWILTYNPWLGQGNTDDIIEWIMPETAAMDPYQYVIVWFDRDNEIGDDFHASFNLTRTYDGEPEDFDSQLYLADRNGMLVDSVIIQNQQTDVSFGRVPDAGSSGEVVFNVDIDLCGFKSTNPDYSRFEFDWILDDEFNSSYTGRNPSHTFTTMDVGTHQIELTSFDTQSNNSDFRTITVEVVAPDLE
jgi:PKD domain-containing protein